jgi:hypothetical protein
MDRRIRTCYRKHLDQFTGWAEAPVMEAKAIETGMHSGRSATVRRLELWVVETLDDTNPRRLDAYDTEEQAIAQAEEILTEPDGRGIYREWNVRRPLELVSGLCATPGSLVVGRRAGEPCRPTGAASCG